MSWHTTSGLLEELGQFSNNAAWHRLAKGLREPIYDFGKSMGLNHEDAADAAQEALATCATRFATYDRNKGRLSKWLFGIAFREVVKCKRKRARRREVDWDSRQWCSLLEERRCGTARWFGIWEMPVVHAYLDRVQAEFESSTVFAFRRTVMDGVTPSDVAREMGINVQTVYAAKHRVVKRLRQVAVSEAI